jgi:hypothetical protein
MTPEATEALVVFVGMYLAIVCGRAWKARTDDLKLGIFRPWRGDPWPIGVQEDDDFRFNWAAAATGSATAGPPVSRDPSGGPDDVPGVVEAPDRPLETVAAGSVPVEPVGRINVRRIGS